MSEFEKLLAELKKHITELDETFINRFIKNRTATLDYEHYVKAYCVLCHAAFEEYFESIALRVMHRCLDEWRHSRKYTDTLITLVSYYKQELVINRNENTNETKVFDSLRGIFDEIEQKFSRAVFNNHGISLQYLRCLLIPVAIDIKEDSELKDSLRKLADQRGEYAHKQRITQVLSPEDAKKCVKDCIELCEDVKTKAESKFIQVLHPFTSYATLEY